jgi:hypothetical protein
VYLIDPVGGEDAHNEGEHQQADVDNRAPHEEGLKRLNGHHNPPPFQFLRIVRFPEFGNV